MIYFCRDLGDPVSEAKAASSLGSVLNQLGQHASALTYHQRDLALSSTTSSDSDDGSHWRGQVRALHAIGLTLEAMGDPQGAVASYEGGLAVAGAQEDAEGKVRALAALGKIHHAALAQMDAAISFLQQALSEIEMVASLATSGTIDQDHF